MFSFVNHALTLEQITDEFISVTGLAPMTATEIEFYLKGSAGMLPEGFENAITKAFNSHNIQAGNIEKERGYEQFEIALSPIIHPIATAQNTNALQDILADAAKKFGMQVNFKAKPFSDQPGNGMHFHISLLDRSGANAMAKPENADESVEMLYAMGGLLETMAESCMFFAPNEDSYDRFTASLNLGREESRHNNAPINVSWGGNNRTVALRIPASTGNPQGRHIEHRVPGADANPYIVLSVILAGMLHGIRNKIMPPHPKIYGSAFDMHYNLQPLPLNLSQARATFEAGTVMPQLFSEIAHL